MGKDWEPIVTRKKGQDIIFLPECAQNGGDAEVTIEQFLKIFDKLVELEYIEPSNRTGTAGQNFLQFLQLLQHKLASSSSPTQSFSSPKNGKEKAEGETPDSSRETDIKKMFAAQAAQREKEKQALALEEDSLAIEQTTYNLYKEREHTFQAEIQPSIPVFHKIMDELIYFAGCRKESDYEERKTLLLNKQELLRVNVQSGMWEASAAFDGIGKMKAALKETSIAPPVNINREENERNEWTSGDYKKEKVTVEAKKKEYAAENKKLRKDESRQRQCLEYVCLLKAFYPIVEEICNQETMDAQWACGIAEQLEKVVAEQQCEFSTNMKFCWVHPDDDAVQQSKQLQIQFRAAEVDCPGLYYRDSDRQNQYVCVVPGCAK